MKNKAIQNFNLERAKDFVTEEGSFFEDPRLDFSLKGTLAIGLNIQRKREVSFLDLWNSTSDFREVLLRNLLKLEMFGYAERIPTADSQNPEALNSKWKFKTTSPGNLKIQREETAAAV